MSRSAFFLGQGTSFGEALRIVDPLEGELLFRLIDPVLPPRSNDYRNGRLPTARFFLFWLALVLPEIVLSITPNHTLGGFFLPSGSGARLSMSHDPALWLQLAIFLPWIFLVAWGRRLVGTLSLHLQRNGVIEFSRNPLQAGTRNSKVLRWLESASRMTPIRSTMWGLAILALNIGNAVTGLISPTLVNWTTSPATPGTVFYPWHVHNLQPNLAGLWHMVVLSAFFGYFLVLAVRLLVVFACATKAIASNDGLRILPTHPDQTGGLLAVGQTALSLSLFTLMAGAWLTVATIETAVIIGPPMTVQKAWMGILLWSSYLTLGPLLFFLPLVPLRSEMERTKMRFLANAEREYRRVIPKLNDSRSAGGSTSENLREHSDLSAMLLQAYGMAVWPLDRFTLRRFVAIVVAPLIPLVLQRLPSILDLLKAITSSGR
jgi:hypothetical protein